MADVNNPAWFHEYEDDQVVKRALAGRDLAAGSMDLGSLDNIDLAEFLNATCTNEPLGVVALKKIFASKEEFAKKSFLERLFTPRYLRKFITEDNKEGEPEKSKFSVPSMETAQDDCSLQDPAAADVEILVKSTITLTPQTSGDTHDLVANLEAQCQSILENSR